VDCAEKGPFKFTNILTPLQTSRSGTKICRNDSFQIPGTDFFEQPDAIRQDVVRLQNFLVAGGFIAYCSGGGLGVSGLAAISGYIPNSNSRYHAIT
jgi:hypothetical protein